MPAFRSLFLVAALLSGALHAADLRVAVLVQDVAQVSSQGNLVPSSTPRADEVAFTDELAREICRRIRSRCAFSYVTFGEILPGVEDGRFDLGCGNFLRSPEREERVAFSEPIFRSASRLVGSPATARAFAGKIGHEVNTGNLRGARVAVMEGTQQQAFLNAIAAERDLTVVATATKAAAFDALRDGGADFALLPVRAGYALISHQETGRFGFVGPAVADHGLGDTVHIILPKQENALRRSVNQAIAEIRADGTWHRIVRRHFPVNLD